MFFVNFNIVQLFGVIPATAILTSYKKSKISLDKLTLKPKYDHISDGLRSLKWLPIREKLILNDATMMHKCINKLVPDYLAGMFKLRSQVHNIQTRSSGALDIPLCRLSKGQRSFAFSGAKLWNSLNDNIKSLKCPKNFRRHFANVLLS